MASYGTTAGLGLGIESAGRSISEGIIQGIRDRNARRDKMAERIEGDIQAASGNLMQITGGMPYEKYIQTPGDHSDATEQYNEIHNLVNQYNSMYGLHETPQLVQRWHLFGKKMAPQQISPGMPPLPGVGPGIPPKGFKIEPASQDAMTMAQAMATAKRPPVRQNLMQELGDWRQTWMVSHPGGKMEDADKAFWLTKTGVAATEDWTDANENPVQVTAENQAQVTQQGKQPPAIGTWVQRQHNKAGEYRYQPIQAGALLSQAKGLQFEKEGGRVTSIFDKDTNKWYVAKDPNKPDGDWVSTEGEPAPPKIQIVAGNTNRGYLINEQIKEKAKADQAAEVANREAWSKTVDRMKTVTQEQIKQFESDRSKAMEKLTPLKAIMDQATQRPNETPQQMWNRFLGAVRDSDWGKGKNDRIDAILGKTPTYLGVFGGTQKTEITNETDFNQLRDALQLDINSYQTMVNSADAAIKRGQDELMKPVKPPLKTRPSAPSEPTAGTRERAAAGGETGPKATADVPTGRTTSGQRGQPPPSQQQQQDSQQLQNIFKILGLTK